MAALSLPTAAIRISCLYLQSESHPLCIPFCFCKPNLKGAILKFPRMSKLPNFKAFLFLEESRLSFKRDRGFEWAVLVESWQARCPWKWHTAERCTEL